MPPNIKVVGVEEAARYLEKAKDSVTRKVQEGLEKSSEFVQKEVEASIAGLRSEPRSIDTGEFFGSVEANVDLFAIEISSTSDHAIFLEYGTSKMAPRMHFRNTASRTKKDVEHFIERAVKTI